LLDGARIPKADQLPKDLAELSLRNGLEIRHASFHSDMERLIRGLKPQSGQANAPHASRLPPDDRTKVEEAEVRQRDEDESRSEETEAKQLARPEVEHDGAEPSLRIVRTLAGHEQRISCIALARDGNTLVSGCGRYFLPPELWIWDIGKGAVRTKLAGHTTSLWDLAFSPDGTILASAATHELRLWSMPDGKLLRTLPSEQSDGCFWTVAFSPDGATLAATTNESGVDARLWRCADGKPLRIFQGNMGSVRSLTYSPDCTFLALASSEMDVQIWRVRDWESWSLGALKGVFGDNAVRNIAFSPDGALFAAGAQLWRVSDWKLIGALEADEFEPRQVRHVAFSPDNSLLATATRIRGTWPKWPDDVQIWRVADKKLLYRQRWPDNTPCLTWTPDGSLLIPVGKTIHLCSWGLRH
jgi:WD40 repeat protein